MNILVIDIGGTHVKILANSEQEKREIESGPTMTAQQMVSSVKELAGDWKYDVLSIGYPGPVVHHRPVAEPRNLGSGWMGLDFAAAFKRHHGVAPGRWRSDARRPPGEAVPARFNARRCSVK